MEETLLHALFGSKFRNDFDGITLILRKLVFDVEGADGINLITEEIDTERIFATVGIDVEDASTNGKLTRFIDVISLLKSEITQLMHDIHLCCLLSDSKFENSLIQNLLGNHEFCQGIWIRNDIDLLASRQSCQHFRSQDFVSRIPLTILDGASVAGRKEEDALLSQHLRKIMIEITRFICIIEHEKHGALHLSLQRTEEHRGRRAHQSLKKDRMNRLLLQ